MIKLLYFWKKILFLFILVVGLTAISKPGLAYVIHDNGWDGPGQNSWSMSYYFGTLTPDLAPVDVKSTLVSALSVWSSVVDITFTETISANQNNAIDFSFVTGNHGDGYPLNPGGALAHGFFPAPPNPETIGGDVHFNDNYLWEIGNSLGGSAFDLKWVAVHEIGHALGLNHSLNGSAVMFPTVSSSTVFSSLHADDIAGIQSIYATATASAAVPEPGTIVLFGIGIFLVFGYGCRRRKLSTK